MQISNNGITLIKSFEGCKLSAYQDGVGVWTIGYGWTQPVDGVSIKRGMIISMALKAISDSAASSSEAARQREHRVQQQLATLNQQHQQEIDNAYREAQRLRTDLDRGHRRVQLATAALATCEQSAGAVSGTGSFGHAGTVRLSATAGRHIHDIRNGIIQDRIRLNYLQAYIRALQAQGLIAADDDQTR